MNTVLIAIIAANVIFSFIGFENMAFFRRYDFHIGSIRAGEQIRMISSGFLHADIPHLAFNMITLYFFAPVVILKMGTIGFLLAYIGSLIFGSLLTFVFHKNDYSYRAIGASGAVTGIIYSAILFDPNMQVYGFIPGYIFGMIYLLGSIYGMKSKRDNIGHVAHFGGAIGGYVITLCRAPYLFSDNLLTVIALAIPIIILFYMAKTGKI
jgi:membrane associated rhomboid family serine protease